MFGWFNGGSTGPSADTFNQVQAAVGNDAAATAVPGQGGFAPVGGVGVPGAGGGQGGFFGPNFANNAGMVLSGVQALGSLWNSYQANKLAKEQIGLQREAFQTNLANQKQTYNTALEDRIRSRYNTEGRSSGEADAYIDKHKL